MCLKQPINDHAKLHDSYSESRVKNPAIHFPFDASNDRPSLLLALWPARINTPKMSTLANLLMYWTIQALHSRLAQFYEVSTTP